MELVTRDQWGARPAKSTRRIKTPVAELWLHHSATRDAGLRSVKAVQRFHQVNRGWSDIAYNWLYSPSTGKFYEGRGAGVQGAHTQGRNTVSHALCVLGNYNTAGVTDKMITDLQGFLKWHGQYGPTRFTGGHKDAPGANTACPGRNLQANLRAINGLVPVPQSQPAQNRPLIRLWDRGAHVKYLQEELNRRGHNLTVDGRYGPLTQHAVTVFQRANGLKADGLVGPKTWGKL
jgi:murein L,D-transpeptidase YcbB/YkuD